MPLHRIFRLALLIPPAVLVLSTLLARLLGLDG